MKKLLTAVIVAGSILFAGSAFAGWSAGVVTGGYASGNYTPSYSYTPNTYGGSWNFNNNVGNFTKYGAGIYGSGGNGVNTTQSFNRSFTTDSGVNVKQSGGYSVQSLPGYKGSIVRSWGSSSVSK